MSFEELDYTRKFDVGIWRKMVPYVWPHRRTLGALIGFSLMLAVTDSVFPLMTMYAIDNFIVGDGGVSIPVFAGAYVFLIAFQVTNIYKFITLAGLLERRIVYDVRKAGFNKLQELSFSYFDNTHVGWIIARMTTDAQKIGDIIAWGAVDLIWGLALVIIIVFNMFMINPQLLLLLSRSFHFWPWLVSIFNEKYCRNNAKSVK